MSVTIYIENRSERHNPLTSFQVPSYNLNINIVEYFTPNLRGEREKSQGWASQRNLPTELELYSSLGG